ncbi:MAG TPA: hypothetical protein VJP77_06370, partial [Planctomycetota bacterium]|nr:hypothetical protein [Planctomycetota bacterium]
MRAWIGGGLLAAGTVLGSLAAARGQRPWVAVPLEELVPGDPECVLAEDLVATLHEGGATTVTVSAGRAGE